MIFEIRKRVFRVIGIALLLLAPSFFPRSAHAGSSNLDFVLIPKEIKLSRVGQTHLLVVEERVGDRLAGDATSRVSLSSSNPAVARILDDEVTAVGNGDALITGVLDGNEVVAWVRVRGAQSPLVRSFRNHVQPVLFKMGCSTGACHGAASGKNGFKLSLRGFDFEGDHEALTRQAGGRRVSLVSPEDSLMLLKPTMSVPHEGGERFTVDSEPYRILREWLEEGAPQTRDEEPVLDHIEVLPTSVTLRKGSTQQFIVRAHYNDGSYEDVTRWVKFGTTDESVALVDELGRATVAGSGSTAITVYYASNVTIADINVPRERPVAKSVFARASRFNFIDDIILRKLERLEIAPAQDIDDNTFIRRAYLDAIGALPTPAEVDAFVRAARKNKRAAVIDELLKRREFVDYWSYKWSDLLLLSSKKLPRSGELDSFYRYIRSGVENNTPWDVFVRDIVTARGNTLDNGAASYFVMHKDVLDLTETTSQAFLGMSITCARCHNHPLEKWTQDDYYGMANLFARVKLKNGKSGGGTDVLSSDFGNVVHPRVGEPMAPRPLDGDAIPLDGPGDRRAHLADWLTSPDNPYFTRAIVNRVWKNFMGRGLVEPEDDLRLTNPASNETLLAALADDLAAHDYDLRYLMRTIMNSAAYQRSSAPSDPSAPDDKYYSQYIIRRLNAEVILDAYAQVTEVPTSFPGYPEGYRAQQLRDSRVASYFLEAFGRPERNQTCSCERSEDPSVAQTLHLANGDTLNDKLMDDASIVQNYLDGEMTNDQIIDDLFMRSLGRRPSERQKKKTLAALETKGNDEGAWEALRGEALEDIAWALLSSKEFLFNH